MRYCTFSELPTNKPGLHVYLRQLLDATFASDQFYLTKLLSFIIFGSNCIIGLCCKVNAVSSTPIKLAKITNLFHTYTHTIQQEQQSKWTFKANFPKSKHVVFVPTIDAECSGKYSHGAMLLKMQPQSYANNIYRRTCVRPLGDAL